MAPLSGTDTHLGVKEMVLTLWLTKEEPLLKFSTFLGGKKGKYFTFIKNSFVNFLMDWINLKVCYFKSTFSSWSRHVNKIL